MTDGPAARYKLTGQFDLESYDRDREEFPSDFDANGWPLFGEYDHDSLSHPITGRPWYEAPRIPSNEEWAEQYAAWFRISESFSKVDNDILSSLRKVPRRNSEVPTPETRDQYYRSGAYKKGLELGVWANLPAFSEIRQSLLTLLEKRQATVELLEIWGDYRQIAERIISSIPQMHVRRAKKDKANRDAEKGDQVRWYKYCRAYFEINFNLSTSKINKTIAEHCWKIINNKEFQESEFGRNWYIALLGETPREPEKDPKPVRALCNATKRCGYNTKTPAEWLQEYEEERNSLPPFPPVDHKSK